MFRFSVLSALAAVFLVFLPAQASAETVGCFTDDDAEHFTFEAVISDCSRLLQDGGDGLTEQKRVEILVNRGIAYRHLGELEKSKKDLEEAVSMSASNASDLRMLAWTHRELGNLQKAESLLTKAIGIDGHWQGYLSRCVVRGRGLSNFQGALGDCQKVIELGLVSEDSVFFTAYNLNELGRHQEALTLMENNMEIVEGSERLQIELKYAKESLG